MDKTYRTELQRYFVLGRFPDSMTRNDAHLQIFDNYLENSRLRLRKIRVPESNEWTWSLQQRLFVDDGLATMKTAEIHLNDAEYRAFESFEGREIRKNRYFFESGERAIAVDAFLGRLWGLIIAVVPFDTTDQLREFEFPVDALEVTRDRFFAGENLVDKSFSQTQARIAEISASRPSREFRERLTARDAD